MGGSCWLFVFVVAVIVGMACPQRRLGCIHRVLILPSLLFSFVYVSLSLSLSFVSFLSVLSLSLSLSLSLCGLQLACIFYEQEAVRDHALKYLECICDESVMTTKEQLAVIGPTLDEINAHQELPLQTFVSQPHFDCFSLACTSQPITFLPPPLSLFLFQNKDNSKVHAHPVDLFFSTLFFF